MDATALGLKVLNTRIHVNRGTAYTIRRCVNKYDDNHIAFSVTNESTRMSKLYNFFRNQIVDSEIPEDIKNDISNRHI